MWWSRRAITLHVALIVAVPMFLTLGAWQLRRALGGNLLSWAYTFEWPFFAAYAGWMWWRLVHEESATPAEPAMVIDRDSRDPHVADHGGASPTATSAAMSAASGMAGAAAGSLSLGRSDYDPFDDDADPELAAYNRYLSGLHAERPDR
jgi:hypothetical protein